MAPHGEVALHARLRGSSALARGDPVPGRLSRRGLDRPLQPKRLLCDVRLRGSAIAIEKRLLRLSPAPPPSRPAHWHIVEKAMLGGRLCALVARRKLGTQ